MPSSVDVGTFVLIVAGVLFLIARQFREKRAKSFMLALVPLLVAYHTYLSAQTELAHPITSSTLIIVFFVIGVVPGALLGFFRGNLMGLRLDSQTRTVYYTPNVANGLFWLGMLVIKVAAGIGIYMRLDQAGALAALLLAAATTLFLGYVCMTCAVLYWRISRLIGPVGVSSSPAR
jgi:hypothetical protein